MFKGQIEEDGASIRNHSKHSMIKGSIAILTSGGDCQGMNSVLYGLACRHLDALNVQISELTDNDNHHQTELYLIHNGFQGLINGTSSFIVKADFKFLQSHLFQGGTVINSSRCREFYYPEGRRKAARNLLNLNIENLIVIGGNGSLVGANFLRKEWSQYVSEFIEKGELDPKRSESQLHLVGIIGSIDNDFYGSEITIGTDSALFRVVESIDALKTTAKSHSRVMIVEVMGRNCGYLAISAALGTQASYVFIPEAPHKSTEEWQKKLISRIKYERNFGQNYHIIIVAEGACDSNGSPIKSQSIKDFLNKNVNLEARLIVLGHLQRGGFTSVFDHLMSIQMGIEAYNILQQQPKKAMILTMNKGQIQTKSLVHCIDEMAKLTHYIKDRNWAKVMEQRGPNFINTWENYRLLMSEPSSSNTNLNDKKPLRQYSWAIVQCCQGLPIPGMNAIIYALVHYGFAQNISVIGFRNGLEGLFLNDCYRFEWQDVAAISNLSGTILGSQPKANLTYLTTINDDSIEKITYNLQSNNVKFICFVGDHVAYEAIRSLYEYRKRFQYLIDAKYCYIPVSITESKPLSNQSNDHHIPWSKLGRDSMLNKTMQLICDLIHSSKGTFNQMYLLRVNLYMISALFAEPILFCLAVGASVIYPRNKSCLNQTIELDVNSITKNALELREMILQTHENKHESLWAKILPIYQRTINFSTKIQLNQVDLTRIQIPTQATPFDRKLGVKLGMECGRYFSDENFETTPLIINTPFLYESKLIKSRHSSRSG